MLITDRSLLEKFDSRHRVWQGIPGIARTKKGRTFISFYSGETSETYGNYAVLLKSDTNTDFGEPIVAIKKEGKFRCFDPVLWIDPLGRLWFFWNVMPGEEVYAAICENPDADELIWGDEFYVGRGIMMNKPTVLSSGEWLFPIAVWKTDIYPNFRKGGLKDDEKAGSYVYKSSDNGKTLHSFRKPKPYLQEVLQDFRLRRDPEISDRMSSGRSLNGWQIQAFLHSWQFPKPLQQRVPLQFPHQQTAFPPLFACPQ